jgi:hypothetical protein
MMITNYRRQHINPITTRGPPEARKSVGWQVRDDDFFCMQLLFIVITNEHSKCGYLANPLIYMIFLEVHLDHLKMQPGI